MALFFLYFNKYTIESYYKIKNKKLNMVAFNIVGFNKESLFIVAYYLVPSSLMSFFIFVLSYGWYSLMFKGIEWARLNFLYKFK